MGAAPVEAKEPTVLAGGGLSCAVRVLSQSTARGRFPDHRVRRQQLRDDELTTSGIGAASSPVK
jgi:hypothetical protein